MTSPCAINRRSSDRFLPEIRRIVEAQLLQFAPDELDIQHAKNGYPLRCGGEANPDGTRFKWFDIRSFPPEPPLMVARSA